MPGRRLVLRRPESDRLLDRGESHIPRKPVVLLRVIAKARHGKRRPERWGTAAMSPTIAAQVTMTKASLPIHPLRTGALQGRG